MLCGGEIKDISNSLANVEQGLDQWLNAVSKTSPEKAQTQLEGLLKQAFQLKEATPFFQTLAQKLDSTLAYQQFRLPGKDIVVSDRREAFLGKPAEKTEGQGSTQENQKTEAPQEKDRPHTDGETKHVKHREKHDVHRANERTGVTANAGRESTASNMERLLSSFEKLLVERFENGREVAHEAKDGKKTFQEKTEGQWKDFFKAFLHRTEAKKLSLSDIKEFLLRGIVNKGEKGVVISDLTLQNGKVEKFARFAVLANMLAKLKGLNPGDVFGKNAFGGTLSEELLILALKATQGADQAVNPKATQGKFLDGKNEAAIQESLGMPVSSHLDKKGLLKKTRGLGVKDLLGDEPFAEDVPYQFIPWWHWGNLKRPGKFKTVTVVFYGTLFILALIGIILLSYRVISN